MLSEQELLGDNLYDAVQRYRTERAVDLRSWVIEVQLSATMWCDADLCTFNEYDAVTRALAASQLLELVFTEQYRLGVGVHQVMQWCVDETAHSKIHMHPQAPQILLETYELHGNPTARSA